MFIINGYDKKIKRLQDLLDFLLLYNLHGSSFKEDFDNFVFNVLCDLFQQNSPICSQMNKMFVSGGSTTTKR